jgi:hypothetical protein
MLCLLIALSSGAAELAVMRLDHAVDDVARRLGFRIKKTILAIGLVLVAAGCGSHVAATAPKAKTSPGEADTSAGNLDPPASLPPAQRIGLPPLKAGVIPGYLLIADRDNNRLIIVSPAKRVVWQFPRPGDLRRHQSFRDPDDAFFTPGYRAISTNEEFNQQIAEVSVGTHRLSWSFGHAGVRGSAFGYLSNPDDAYLLPTGLFMVADIQNCRVLFVSRAHKVVREIGSAGNCGHDPPSGLSSPNGATPLRDGGVLVTEIGGWVDRIDRRGQLVYTVRTPTTYPSDAQLLPNGNILVAGFGTPGRVDELTPKGRIVWTYAPSGYWSLDRPSLAVRWPNGLIAITDDWHHRVLVIDPKTKRVVWSYGHLNQPGSAPGFLNKPDGLDLLPAVSVPAKARRRAASRVRTQQRPVARVGTLPQEVSKASVVGLPDGRLMVLGGETGGTSTSQVLRGVPERLRTVGRLPQPTHDAAAAVLGRSVYLFGGGQATSLDTIVRVNPATGASVDVGHLDEPLSDLGAVTIGGAPYLIGGFTGVKFASAVLRYRGGGKTTVVARLPEGTRYAGVAALQRRIYVAGGLTPRGITDAVYEVVPGGRVRRIGRLPVPEDHAAMAPLGSNLYLVGGRKILRIRASGAVSLAAHLPVTLTDPAVVALGNRLVIVGGGTRFVFAFTPG